MKRTTSTTPVVKKSSALPLMVLITS